MAGPQLAAAGHRDYAFAGLVTYYTASKQPRIPGMAVFVLSAEGKKPRGLQDEGFAGNAALRSQPRKPMTRQKASTHARLQVRHEAKLRRTRSGPPPDDVVEA